MQSEKVLIVLVVSTIVVLGFAVGFTFLNSDGGTSNNHSSTTTTTNNIAQDVDLLNLGIQLPDWSLAMSDGSFQSLHSLRGRFVVVDLMATWCSSCAFQNGNLKTLYNNMGDTIHMISLTVDLSETEAMMAAYMEDKDLPWPHGLDTQSVFSNYFNIQYIPSIVILDDEGYLRWFHVGLWSEAEMAETLALLMG
ncbi:MAG: TlpA family protein disulfide reductase [Candidatus Thorarchaeota archaeon]